jgi:hypothetical protein
MSASKVYAGGYVAKALPMVDRGPSIAGSSAALDPRLVDGLVPLPAIERWPLRQRVMVLAGLTALSWATIGSVAYLILG